MLLNLLILALGVSAGPQPPHKSSSTSIQTSKSVSSASTSVQMSKSVSSASVSSSLSSASLSSATDSATSSVPTSVPQPTSASPTDGAGCQCTTIINNYYTYTYSNNSFIAGSGGRGGVGGVQGGAGGDGGTVIIGNAGKAAPAASAKIVPFSAPQGSGTIIEGNNQTVSVNDQVFGIGGDGNLLINGPNGDPGTVGTSIQVN